MTTEQQQDDFALQFAYFLDKNYVRTGKDEYTPIPEQGKTILDYDQFTAAECLVNFRKQWIPKPPAIDSLKTRQEIAADYAQMNRLLMEGYIQIQARLSSQSPLDKQDINTIILSTLKKIPTT